MNHSTRQPIKSVVIEAIVTRKDGTVENLGVIAMHHSNPLRRLAWRVSQFMRGRKPGRVSFKG